MKMTLEEKLRAEIRLHESRLEAARGDLASLTGLARDLPVVSLADAFKEEDRDPEWILEELLPLGGTGLLSAHGGTGKTTLLVQGLAQIAAGQPFLDARCPASRKVLFLQAEGSRRIFKDRVRTAVHHLQLPDEVRSQFLIPTKGFNPPLFTSPDFEELVVSTGAKLIVCDTVGYFFDGDENNNNDVKKFVMRPLAHLGAKYEVAFVLVHHYGKPSDHRVGRHKTRGASAWIDDSDLAMRLERVEGSPKELLLFFDKIKHGPDRDPLGFVYDGSSATFAATGTKAQTDESAQKADQKRAQRDREIGKVRFAIIDFLRRNPEGATSRAIRDGVPGRASVIDEARKELYANGQLVFDHGPRGSEIWKLATTPGERRDDDTES
jgi:RecA-family ATPase